MLFEIMHRTEYRYGHPASEACVEARLTPRSDPGQTVLAHEIEFAPGAPLSDYEDYFGNTVTFFAMARRHDHLSIVNRMTVRTHDVPLPAEALAISVAETRQLLSSRMPDIFDYLQPTAFVPTGGTAMDWARRHLPGHALLGEALAALNHAIHKKFRYQPGATDTATPLATVWKQRAGVCQDFSHIMLSVLRTAGLPARYVCGYIESDPVRGGRRAPRLIGSLATHAWVEVLAPGMCWVALDPTNNQWCGTRHVSMARGRDFDDAAPVRGTFKGSGNQDMKVKVTMKRLAEKP